MSIFGQHLLFVLVVPVALFDDQRGSRDSTTSVMEVVLGRPMGAVVVWMQVASVTGVVAIDARECSVRNSRLTFWFAGSLDFTAHELQIWVLRES